MSLVKTEICSTYFLVNQFLCWCLCDFGHYLGLSTAVICDAILDIFSFSLISIIKLIKSLLLKGDLNRNGLKEREI